MPIFGGNVDPFTLHTRCVLVCSLVVVTHVHDHISSSSPSSSPLILSSQLLLIKRERLTIQYVLSNNVSLLHYLANDPMWIGTKRGVERA